MSIENLKTFGESLRHLPSPPSVDIVTRPAVLPAADVGLPSDGF